jgi:hypothetical protein
MPLADKLVCSQALQPSVPTTEEQNMSLVSQTQNPRLIPTTAVATPQTSNSINNPGINFYISIFLTHIFYMKKLIASLLVGICTIANPQINKTDSLKQILKAEKKIPTMLKH